MPEFTEYDPSNGITYAVDEFEGKEYMRKTENVELVRKVSMFESNTGARDSGIKAGWWKVANVPTTIVLEMMKQGYDIMSKDDAEFWRAMRYFKSTYPDLCTTNKRFA
jgi:hypothetical protein